MICLRVGDILRGSFGYEGSILTTISFFFVFSRSVVLSLVLLRSFRHDLHQHCNPSVRDLFLENSLSGNSLLHFGHFLVLTSVIVYYLHSLIILADITSNVISESSLTNESNHCLALMAAPSKESDRTSKCKLPVNNISTSYLCVVMVYVSFLIRSISFSYSDLWDLRKDSIRHSLEQNLGKYPMCS